MVEAGISPRCGRIHFRAADLAERLLGRLVAYQAWSKAQSYFDGTAASAHREKPELLLGHPEEPPGCIPPRAVPECHTTFWSGTLSP